MSFMSQSGRWKAEPETVSKELLTELCDINRRIFASIGDMNETIQLITSNAQSFTNVKRCTLWLVDPEDDTMLMAKDMNKEEFVQNKMRSFSIFFVLIIFVVDVTTHFFAFLFQLELLDGLLLTKKWLMWIMHIR